MVALLERCRALNENTTVRALGITKEDSRVQVVLILTQAGAVRGNVAEDGSRSTPYSIACASTRRRGRAVVAICPRSSERRMATRTEMSARSVGRAWPEPPDRAATRDRPAAYSLPA